MPTSSEPTSPGPCVTAMASKSSRRLFACCMASRTTGTICRKCSREASSGTTPPYLRWTSICDATTLDKISRPSATTAAAVSSHEDSIPRMRVLIEFPFRFLQFQILQVFAEVAAKLRILQGDFHSRFQKSQFVARIVGNTFVYVRPQTIFLRQNAQRVGQLNFVSRSRLGARQTIKNLRRQYVASGYRQV